MAPTYLQRFLRESPHTRILRSGHHHLHHHLHHLLLQTRYLLTGTRRNVNFFTTRLHGPLRCARTSRDRLSPPVRAKVRLWHLETTPPLSWRLCKIHTHASICVGVAPSGVKYLKVGWKWKVDGSGSGSAMEVEVRL